MAEKKSRKAVISYLSEEDFETFDKLVKEKSINKSQFLASHIREFIEENASPFVVYMTINKINGMMYIGRDSSDRNNYIGSGSKLALAIAKYGKENFEKIILERCNSFEELKQREEYWIEKYQAKKNDNFYNMTNGSVGREFIGGKKIQTTLSDEDERALNQIINAVGLEREEVISQTQYVRELIIHHIRMYNGEQKSFVNENVQRLIRNLELKKDTKNG